MRTVEIRFGADVYQIKVDEANRCIQGECGVCGGGFKDLFEWLERIGAVKEVK